MSFCRALQAGQDLFKQLIFSIQPLLLTNFQPLASTNENIIQTKMLVKSRKRVKSFNDGFFTLFDSRIKTDKRIFNCEHH